MGLVLSPGIDTYFAQRLYFVNPFWPFFRGCGGNNPRIDRNLGPWWWIMRRDDQLDEKVMDKILPLQLALLYLYFGS